MINYEQYCKDRSKHLTLQDFCSQHKFIYKEVYFWLTYRKFIDNKKKINKKYKNKLYYIKFPSGTNILFLSKEFAEALHREYTNDETRTRPDLESKGYKT